MFPLYLNFETKSTKLPEFEWTERVENSTDEGIYLKEF